MIVPDPQPVVKPPIRLVREEEPSYDAQPTGHRYLTDSDVQDAIQLMGSGAWAVYSRLTRRANADGRCHPSQESIAEETRISVRHVKRLLSDLEAAGWIKRTSRENSFGFRSSTEYFLPFYPKPRTDGGDIQGDIQGDISASKMSPKDRTKTGQERDDVSPLPPKRKSPDRPWPDDFALTDKMRQYAIDQGIYPHRVEPIFEGFHLKSLAKGYRYVDWEKAWQTWVRSSYQDRDRAPTTTQPETGVQRAIRMGIV